MCIPRHKTTAHKGELTFKKSSPKSSFFNACIGTYQLYNFFFGSHSMDEDYLYEDVMIH